MPNCDIGAAQGSGAVGWKVMVLAVVLVMVLAMVLTVVLSMVLSMAGGSGAGLSSGSGGSGCWLVGSLVETLLRSDGGAALVSFASGFVVGALVGVGVLLLL